MNSTTGDKNVRPIPDPTALTTMQLLHEITSLRQVLDARMDGMDKVINYLQDMLEKRPIEIAERISQLQHLHEERFKSIALQFIERDTRTEQTSRDSKVAVDAALQAAKEAVGAQNMSNSLAMAKSESAFTKQLDQIHVLIDSIANNTNDKVDDLKTRFAGMETKLTSHESKDSGGQDRVSHIGSIIFGVVVVVTSIATLIGILVHLTMGK